VRSGEDERLSVQRRPTARAFAPHRWASRSARATDAGEGSPTSSTSSERYRSVSSRSSWRRNSTRTAPCSSSELELPLFDSSVQLVGKIYLQPWHTPNYTSGPRVGNTAPISRRFGTLAASPKCRYTGEYRESASATVCCRRRGGWKGQGPVRAAEGRRLGSPDEKPPERAATNPGAIREPIRALLVKARRPSVTIGVASRLGRWARGRRPEQIGRLCTRQSFVSPDRTAALRRSVPGGPVGHMGRAQRLPYGHITGQPAPAATPAAAAAPAPGGPGGTSAPNGP